MPISQAANAYSHDLWNQALTSVMASDQIRADLPRQLEARGIELKAASLALGRNHAYLHRFIPRGIPRYLHEEDRRALADLYQINVERLMPPAKKPSVQRQIPLNRAPRPGDPIHDFREAALVGTWRNLSEEQRELILRMLDGLDGGPSNAVAA